MLGLGVFVFLLGNFGRYLAISFLAQVCCLLQRQLFRMQLFYRLPLLLTRV